MSQYTTEELIEYLRQLITVSTNLHPEPRDIDAAKMSIVIAKLRAADKLCETIMKEVNSQIEDEALWFLNVSVSEAYLQQELRKLHGVIEKAIATHEAGEEKGNVSIKNITVMFFLTRYLIWFDLYWPFVHVRSGKKKEG